MKTGKRIASVVLMIMMLVTMALPALGADPTYTITINGAIEGETYTAYKIFDVTYSGDNYAYTIHKTNAFYDVIAEYTYEYDETTEGKEKVFTLTKIGDTPIYNVEIADAVKNDENMAADLAQCLSKAYANMTEPPASGVTGTHSTTTTTPPTNFVTFDLDEEGAGYYFVTTTVGTLCFLNTTAPTLTITEKNKVPTIEKKVKEGDDWVDENDAEFNEKVEFKTTIYAKKGAVKYVLHDKMDAGFTFDSGSVVVKVGDTPLVKYDSAEEEKAKNSEEEYKYDYTLTTTDLTDGCTFEIKFEQTYLDTITSDTNIVVEYSAILNENAFIFEGKTGSDVDKDVNKNTAKLNYGSTSSCEDSTKTKTYEFDVVKTGPLSHTIEESTDGESEPKKTSYYNVLDGAEFKLYDKKIEIKLVAVKDDDEKILYYRVATDEEMKEEGFASASIKAGVAKIKGLEAGIYYLSETVAPAGHNPLSEKVTVEVGSGNPSNLINKTEGTEYKDTDGGVHVINNTGTELPATGGIGTTIFYCAGAALTLGALVLLITKKRMQKQ